MIECIKHIDALMAADLPRDQFTIVNSAWLALMGLRVNDDLDIVISKTLWRERFGHIAANKSFGIPGANQKRLRVHAQQGPYVLLDDVADTDDLVHGHSLVIDDVRFVEPRLYFLYKTVRLAEMKGRLDDLPFWRHLPFAAGRHAKPFRKQAKDVKDFQSLKRFFAAGLHREGALADIPLSAWGLEDAALAGYLH